jgi:hypothetical protein
MTCLTDNGQESVMCDVSRGEAAGHVWGWLEPGSGHLKHVLLKATGVLIGRAAVGGAPDSDRGADDGDVAPQQVHYR